jgi:hypothetical protein
MSFRNVASLVMTGLLVAAAAAADPSAPSAALEASAPSVNASAPPDAPPGECLDLEGKRIANVDCAELEARLGVLARIGEVQGRIEDARAKVAEARQKRDAIEHPKPQQPAVGAQKDSATAIPTTPPEAGRLLEIFGDQARIRWRGGEYLVRPGQRLPGGAWLVQVSMDGAVIADGKHRTTLPFVIGAQP